MTQNEQNSTGVPINRILQNTARILAIAKFKPCSLKIMKEELGFVKTFLFEFNKIQILYQK